MTVAKYATCCGIKQRDAVGPGPDSRAIFSIRCLDSVEFANTARNDDAILSSIFNGPKSRAKSSSTTISDPEAF
jgi:hypothetical protein